MATEYLLSIIVTLTLLFKESLIHPYHPGSMRYAMLRANNHYRLRKIHSTKFKEKFEKEHSYFQWTDNRITELNKYKIQLTLEYSNTFSPTYLLLTIIKDSM